MCVKVRLGSKDDILALVKVECSDVEQWYHYTPKGRGEPSSYNELSPLERVMHGGPWMDPVALTKYWKDIERLGIMPLVAELDGKVVGQLDVIFSEEVPLGRFLYLDVLMVHKAYRRRGVATALIEHAETLAKNRGVGFMLVSPQQYDGPSGLTYRSCGFEKAFDAYELEASIEHLEVPSQVQLISIPHIQEPPVKTHAMMCGWYNISVKTWDYGVNPDMEYLHFFSCHELAILALTGKNTHFFHLQQDRFDHSRGSICLWAHTSSEEKELRNIFQAAEAAASWLGIQTLTTKTLERYTPTLEKMGFKIRSKGEPYLTKNINE